VGWFTIGFRETTAHPLMRWVSFALAVLFGVGALQAIEAVSSPAAHAANVSCVTAGATAQNGYTEAPSHGQVMYIDSGVSPKIDAAYVGYRITNNSGTAKSIWVQLDNFTGGKVGLANPKDAFQELPNLANGSTATAFFLLKATGSSTSAQTHTMKVFEQRPDLVGSTAKFTCDFAFVKVAETIKANANKIGTVSSLLSPSTATLGGTLSISIDNTASTTTGTLGAGAAPDYSAFWASPAAYSSWPTRALRLEKTTITMSCQTGADIVLTNMLFVSDTTAPANNTLANCIKSGQGSRWYATYTFRIIGPGPSSVTPSPVADISSGSQYKHSDISGVAFTFNGTTSTTITGLNNVSAANSATVRVAASASGAGNGSSITVQYTVTITSDTVDPAGIQVDEVVDTHASGTSYVSGTTSTKLGTSSTTYSAAPNPQTLASDASLSPPPAHFIGPYGLINSTHTQYIQYSFSVPCNGTAYKNTVVAYTGDVTIGSSSTAASAITVSAPSGSGTCGTPTITTTSTSLDPTAQTSPADTITSTSANINGIFNASGTTGSQYQFVYSTDPNLVNGVSSTTLTTLTAGSSSNTAGTAGLSGLSSGTVYYFQARIQNAAGRIFYGAVLSFVTLQSQAAPSVTTNAASAIGLSAATLNGTVSPNGTQITGVYFYYSSSSALTASTTTLAALAANQYAVQTDVGTSTPTSGNLTYPANTFGAQTFNSDSISAVQKDFSTFTGTIYFQAHITCTVVATYCPNGYVDGAVLSFTLGSASATTNAANSVGDTSATLNGVVNNNSSSGTTNISFCYGPSNTSTLGQLQGSCTLNSSPTPSSATGTADVQSSLAITGLTAGTVYYFQVIANTGVKTTYGAILSFQTLNITTASLPNGSIGNSYTASLAGVGGSTTYNWSATGLPTGLTISQSGLISGTTTTAGTYSVVVTMTDPSSGLSTTKTYSVVVSGPSASTTSASGITASAATLNGTVNLNNVVATSINLCWGTDSALATCTNVNIASQVASNGSSSVSTTISSGLTAGTTYYYKIVVAYTGGSVTSNITSFVPVAGPVASTTAATSVSTTSATLNGSVNLNGNTATSANFCWGTDATLATCTTLAFGTPASLVAGDNAVATTISTGLTAGTTYYYKVVVVYGSGTVVTSNITSFIPRSTPTTLTTAASSVTATSGSINGTINLNGYTASAAQLCWGTASDMTGCVSIDVSDQTTSVSASNNISKPLTSLTPGTTYYYRISVTYSGGTVTSNITNFVPSSAPTATTTSASSVTSSSATVNGTVDLHGTSPATAVFCWGSTVGLGTCTNLSIASPSSLSVSTSNTVSATINSGLTAGTTYYYEIVVTYGVNTVTSNITSFVPTGTPTVTTSAATGVTSTTATFNGLVTLNGNGVNTASFCWGTTSSLTTCDSIDVKSQVSSVSGTNTISQLVSALAPHTTYYYQLVVGTTAGTITSSPIISFTTAYASTNAVTAIGLSSATLNGTLYAGSTAISTITSVKLCYSSAATLTNGVLDTTPTCSGNLWTSGTIAANGSLAFSYNLTNLTTPPPLTFQTQIQVVFATSPSVVANGSVVPFTTLNNPDVAINSATSVSSKGARIRGLVYPKGNRLSKVSFCYYETSQGSGTAVCSDPVSTTDLSNNSVGWNGTTNTGNTDMVLSGLKPHTNYTYYLVANAQASAIRFRAADIRVRRAAVSPTVQSSTTTFTTAGAETFAATNVANTSATLNGTLYASSVGISSSDVTDVRICYSTDPTTASTGPTTGAMTTTNCVSGLWANSTIAANGSLAYAPSVTGLLAGTKYYFQIQTTFADGATAYGSVLNFTTTQPPTASTSPATLISQNSATLNGSFNALGSTVTSVTICWDTADSFTTCNHPITISAPTGGWISGSNLVSTSITGLSSNTRYYFTVIALTSTGTATATTANFTTKSVVTFDSQGAGSYASQTYASTGTITDPGTPSKSGYTFTGWWTAASGGTQITSFPYSPTGTGDFTLYAQWTADAHTIHFNDGIGSPGTLLSNTKTFYSDSSVDVTDVTTSRTGYNFLGWFTSTSSTTAVTSPYAPGVYTDVTLYAKWQAISYNVTYNANGTGATGGSSGTYTIGSTLVRPSDPSRPGYSFLGWFTADGVSSAGTAANFSTAQTGTGDLTFYAHWQAYSVSFKYSNGDATTIPDGSGVITLPAGTSLTVPSGSYFAGWACPAGTSTLSVGSTFTPTGNVTCVAMFAITGSKTITFHSNDPLGSNGTATQTSNVSAQLSPNPFNVVGYTFVQWIVGSASGTTFMQSTDTYDFPNQADLALYGQWVPTSYDVTYDPVGGTTTPNGSYSVTTPTSKPADPTLSGYTFQGWSTAAGTIITWTNGTYQPTGTGTLALHAHWLRNPATITFNSNYPSGTQGTHQQTSNQLAVALDAPTFTLSGYSFVKWAKGTANSGVYMLSTDTYDFGADLSLYAIWSPNSYVVNFHGQQPTSPTLTSGTYNTGGQVALASSPGYTGYTFLGWSNSINGSVVAAPSATSYSPGTIGTLDLYAQWSAESYVVTFDSQGGTSVASATYVTGGTIAAPSSTPTKSGNHLNGWFVASTGGSALTFAYAPGTTGPVTLYAQWTPWVISFNAGSGTVTSGQSLPANINGSTTNMPGGTSLTPPANYHFTGWACPTGTTTIASGGSFTATADVVCTAVYAVNGSKTVTFYSNYPSGGPSASTVTQTTNATTQLTGNTFVMPGYTFIRWIVGSNTGTTYMASTDTYDFSADLSLFADWQVNAFTVSFQLGSGGGSPATGTAPGSIAGASVTLPGQGSMIAPSGYQFTGWVCPTGTVLLAGAIITPTGTTTCTAVWSLLTAKTVTFHSNYPIGANPSPTVQTSSGPHALNRNPFVAGGYRFVGWATTSTGAKSYDNTDVYDFSTDADLYALWEVIPTATDPSPVYQIVFVYQGGTPGVTVTYYAPGEPGLKLPTTEKPGYTFTGWATAPTSSSTVSAPFTTAASVTLFAVWAPKQVTITFNYLGGITGIRTMSYTVGQPGMTGLPSSTKQGYEFAGWSEISGGSTAVTEPYSPLESLTLYAIWNGTKYTVTIMPQTGAPIKMVYTVGGDPLQLPGIGTKPGLVPLGWAPDNHATAAVPNEYRPSSTVTLYPLWLTDRLKTPLYFAGDSSVLDAKAKAILKATAKKIIAANLKPTLVVDGWVKATLDTSYDQKLSQARAVQTAAYLRSLGINAFAKLTPKGIAPQNNPTARRVDMAVYLGGPKVKK